MTINTNVEIKLDAPEKKKILALAFSSALEMPIRPNNVEFVQDRRGPIQIAGTFFVKSDEATAKVEEYLRANYEGFQSMYLTGMGGFWPHDNLVIEVSGRDMENTFQNARSIVSAINNVELQASPTSTPACQPT